MRIISKFICGFAIASAAAVAASAQGWRGIEPIGSTCKDIERILGGSACGRQTTDYRLPAAYVRFVFSELTCDPKWSYEQYDVPPGTVTWFVMIPRYPARLFVSDLKLDVSKFQKGDPEDMLNTVVYLSSELGLKITASEDSGEIVFVPTRRRPGTIIFAARARSRQNPPRGRGYTVCPPC